MNSRSRAAAVGLSLVTALLAGRMAGCDSDSASVTADAGADSTAADVRVPRRDAGDPPPTDATHPSPYPGWAHYADYDPACEFYVPETPADLPPPIRWQPCRALAETAGKSCQEMVIDWKPKKVYPNEFITPGTSGFRRKDGSVGFMTARFQEDGTYRLVADSSGRVLVAIREQRPDHCVLANMPSNDDQYIFAVLDSEAKGSVSDFGGGAIGGDVNTLRPTVLRHYHDAIAREYSAGSNAFVDVTGGPLKLSAWSNPSNTEVLQAPEDAALKYNYQFFFRDVLFWSANGSGINKQKVWTRGGGVKDFLAFGIDVTRGAADLGTDGTHLVWLEASGRSTGSGVYPSVVAVASPFTTDPSLIQRRVLRSDLSGYSFGVSPFVVGCGYAARDGFVNTPEGEKGGTILLRISDGAMWLLPSAPAVEWSWNKPLGITCDEIFVLTQSNVTAEQPVRQNIARVRIDSLGAPLPP